MNREYNHYLNVEGSQISISEEQYDHLTLITYNARIKIEKHIERYFTTEIRSNIRRRNGSDKCNSISHKRRFIVYF